MSTPLFLRMALGFTTLMVVRHTYNHLQGCPSTDGTTCLRLLAGWQDDTLIIRSTAFAKHLQNMPQVEPRFLRVCFSAGKCANNACPSNCRNFVPVALPLGHTCNSNATAHIRFNTSVCIFCVTPEDARPLRFRYDGRRNIQFTSMLNTW